MNNQPTVILIGIVVVVLVFLAIRRIICWYWKINRMVALLESIDSSLKQLPAVRHGTGD
ncbi:MAG TPA: hypothetical protein VJN94_09855 [Candidatus Binataceae bacterium]|nr:hypothetical protein [Candidatus Binataceae bacterium]